MEIYLHVMIERGFVLERGHAIKEILVLFRLQNLVSVSIGFLVMHERFQLGLQGDEIVALLRLRSQGRDEGFAGRGSWFSF